MGIFVSVGTTVECIIIAVALACASELAAFKLLGLLQSCGYSNKKFLRWCSNKGSLQSDRLSLLGLCCALSCAVIALCFSFAGRWASVISLAGFIIFFALFIIADMRKALRVPATFTPRFKRLAVVLWLVLAIVSYIVATLLNFSAFAWGNFLFGCVKYFALAIIPLILIPLTCLSNLICGLYERPRNASYVRRAKAKIQASQIKVIGVTGSYGKTSVKHILAAVLSRKYRVLSTPRSHNTPLGLSRAINDNDLENYDFFIAEMGARNVGDIKELCALCSPDYAVITGICPQHIESFLTVENIVKAKGEILESVKNKAFIAPDCLDMFADYPVEKVNCDCVSEVEATCEGVRFTLTLGGESVKVKSKLLGEHSAYNIGLCARVAYELGMTLSEIAAAAEELDYIEHRLQLIESNGVHILDDGYNANVKGAEAAVNVLKSFGGRKIIVTPGLVELGVLDEEENAALGAKLVGLDKVILVGDTLVGFVKQGYTAAGGDEDKLCVVPTLSAAQDTLKDCVQSGDTVLFLNDLPDVY